jgi:hypothetical protein
MAAAGTDLSSAPRRSSLRQHRHGAFVESRFGTGSRRYSRPAPICTPRAPRKGGLRTKKAWHMTKKIGSSGVDVASSSHGADASSVLVRPEHDSVGWEERSSGEGFCAVGRWTPWAASFEEFVTLTESMRWSLDDTARGKRQYRVCVEPLYPKGTIVKAVGERQRWCWRWRRLRWVEVGISSAIDQPGTFVGPLEGVIAR